MYRIAMLTLALVVMGLGTARADESQCAPGFHREVTLIGPRCIKHIDPWNDVCPVRWGFKPFTVELENGCTAYFRELEMGGEYLGMWCPAKRLDSEPERE